MRTRLRAWAGVSAVLAGWLGMAAATGACSSKKSTGIGGDGVGADDGGGGDDGTGGGGDDGTGGGSGGGNGSQFTGQADDAGGPSNFDAACATSTQKGEQKALNAYMMLDYSGSMIGAKWNGVTSALNSFVKQPSSGISVGLQYFGLPDSDGGAVIFGLGDSCNPAVYAKPEIEIAPLPGVGPQITASLMNHPLPNTGTPTVPALQGAIDHASEWSKAHPKDTTIAILATDGEPSGCGTLADVVNIAKAGVAADPKILTFVIGVGNDLSNLNMIAQAGGTSSAFIVDTTMDVSKQFLDALDKIRGAALGCKYSLPVPKSGDTIDTARVNVQYTPTGGKSAIVPQVADAAHCPKTGNAWYYDTNPPTQIILCTSACGTISAGGTVDVLTGCQTVVEPVK